MEVVVDASGLSVRAGCVLVPTMGALHEGHLSLVRRGVEAARRREPAGGVVVSIFVNPTQFGPSEDYGRYPRTMETDVRACEAAGADAVFAPTVEQVYPPGGTVRVPRLPAVATQPGLEDRIRPGHLAGVCQVVLRLFELVRPSAAVFGEKDWQQLQVVEAMVEQERLGIEIVRGATVREADGLAMSSRNRFLSGEDRRRGQSLSRALERAREESDADGAERVMASVMREAGVESDYAVVRDSRTLAARRGAGAGRSGPGSMRALVAGRVGAVRLLDNAAWGRG